MQVSAPPARTGPRPLPLHLAMEGWISQLCFAGLMTSSAVSASSNRPSPPLPPLPDFLPKALAESRPLPAGQKPPVLDPVRLIDAVTAAAKARLQTFATGVARYQTHAPQPAMPLP